jgi:hypothetical protein
MTSPQNMSASVRQRLLNRARSDHRPFNELLQYYAMERFLYRLSQSVHVPFSFKEVAVLVDGFLSPIVAVFSSGKQSPTTWTAPGPWAYAGELPSENRLLTDR